MSAGDVHYISGTLRLGRASAVTAVTEITACRAHGATHRLDTVLGKAITGQNIKPGRAADALTARFEFRAPSDGVYDCALDAIFINHDAETTGRIYVLSGSVLVDARGPLVAHAQVFTPHKALVTNRTDTALISKYAVPGTVAVVDVIGDVNVTNCYGGYGICPDVNEPDSSSMTSQLIINQLNGDGSLCQQTTDQRLLSPPIDPTVHHYKAYHRQNTVPVLARCTSRTFTVYIRVWRSGGNTFEIENNTQTYTFIFDH
jgi:hypothetical protein